jgi:hypothetical protein
MTTALTDGANMESHGRSKFATADSYEGVWKTFEIESTRFREKDFSRYMDCMESELKGYYSKVKELAWCMSLRVEITVTALDGNRPSFPFENEVYVDCRMSESDFQRLVRKQLFQRDALSVECGGGRSKEYSQWMSNVANSCPDDGTLQFTVCRYRENDFVSPTKRSGGQAEVQQPCLHGLHPHRAPQMARSQEEAEGNGEKVEADCCLALSRSSSSSSDEDDYDYDGAALSMSFSSEDSP